MTSQTNPTQTKLSGNDQLRQLLDTNFMASILNFCTKINHSYFLAIISTDTSTDIRTDISTNILTDISTDITTDILTNITTDIATDIAHYIATDFQLILKLAF